MKTLIFSILAIFFAGKINAEYDGSCGKGIGSCPDNLCCSQFGWCGSDSQYCGIGCKSEFGRCDNVDNKPAEPTTTQNSVPSSSPSSSIDKSESSKYVVGYYSEWKYNSYPPKSIIYEGLTHINYAFGTINPGNFALEYDSKILSEVVSTAHSNGVKVLLSIGGWYGSRYFTRMTSSSDNMTKFVASCADMMKSTGADGVDLDWEYPGREGACNEPDVDNDTPNLLKLLKKLHDGLPGGAIISGAVSTSTFQVSNTPIADVSEFAKYFDFINIMGYDFAGSWSQIISHHSSLEVASKGDGLSVKGAVANWTNAGFPINKIVIGIPAYGKSWIAKDSSNNGLFQEPADRHPKGDQSDSNEAWTNSCGQIESQYSSQWKYANIRSTLLSSEDYSEAVSGWIRSWDDKAMAPSLYNKNTKQVISYDDPQSVALKADYINKAGLAGAMIWELEEDTKDGELLMVLHNKLNKSSKPTSTSTSVSTSTPTSEPERKCPVYGDYPCCSNCQKMFEDDYLWGVENNEWCLLNNECKEILNNCWSEIEGYPCCESCNVVLEESRTRKWSIENDQWCGTPLKCFN